MKIVHCQKNNITSQSAKLVSLICRFVSLSYSLLIGAFLFFGVDISKIIHCAKYLYTLHTQNVETYVSGISFSHLETQCHQQKKPLYSYLWERYHKKCRLCDGVKQGFFFFSLGYGDLLTYYTY